MNIKSKESTASGYHYLVLQQGALPLQPDRTVVRTKEHRCTSVLLWPFGQSPSPDNTLLTDPCFTAKSLRSATAKLKRCQLKLSELSRIFLTHRHGDHLPSFPPFEDRKRLRLFTGKPSRCFSHVRLMACPGHSPDSRCLLFPSSSGQTVCIAGDAILNKAWLIAWGYYWPNSYTASEIIQTWRSVADILMVADCILPGHGRQITVSRPLLTQLLKHFDSAPHAADCPDVKEKLQQRIEQLHPTPY